jgi:hypothetical protein
MSIQQAQDHDEQDKGEDENHGGILLWRFWPPRHQEKPSVKERRGEPPE